MERPWLELRVLSRRMEAEGIVALVLGAPNGGDLPPFSAGSHIDVEVAPGMVRQYSLCNMPGSRDHYEIAVLREPASRGGSIALHERFLEGDAIRVGEPRNLFTLRPPSGECLLLAGGIGITPLLCMAERLSTIGAEFRLHYCTRSPARTAFRERIAAAPFADRTIFHFDDGPESQRLDPGALFGSAAPAPDVYICGPPGFIAWIEAAAADAGIPAGNVHREYFASAPAETKADMGFQLRLASSGLTIDVGAGESAAAALARHGIEIPVSCEQGICGTCVTRVIEGEPDHRDMLMIDSNEEFTPCCSRALTPMLVIDL